MTTYDRPVRERSSGGGDMDDQRCATCECIQTELDRIATLLRRAQADRVSQAVHVLERRQRGMQGLMTTHHC